MPDGKDKGVVGVAGQEVHDPTGAGDTFAGGFVGYLSTCTDIDGMALRRAVAHGTVMASFNSWNGEKCHGSHELLTRKLRGELDEAQQRARIAQAELDALMRDYAGRETPLYFASRLTEELGPRIWLKPSPPTAPTWAWPFRWPTT